MSGGRGRNEGGWRRGRGFDKKTVIRQKESGERAEKEIRNEESLLTHTVVPVNGCMCVIKKSQLPVSCHFQGPD